VLIENEIESVSFFKSIARLPGYNETAFD